MKKYKLGYTAGVFDMFHVGHLNILRRAKERCDCLIVGVTTDELCRERKGRYPVIGERERMEILSAVRYVDRVVPQADMDKAALVGALGCDAVFVGGDWQGTPEWAEYESQLELIGADVVYLPHTDGISTTMIRRVLGTFGGGRGGVT